MATPSKSREATNVSIRPMQQGDLEEARRICRVAFGTFLRAPDPETFWSDREYISTRWQADPGAALVAEINGKLAGSNFATHWGSFAFFGPLTILPEFWDQRIAQKLLGPTMELFAKWSVREAGLFTFAQSPKHIGLYQKFGFWPRFLTAIMSKVPESRPIAVQKFSALSGAALDQALAASRKLTDSIYEGLDLTGEVRAVQDQGLGETVLVWGGDSLDGFAVCHCGEGTEGGRDTCYVKFAAAKSGPDAERRFDLLLDTCEALAVERGLRCIVAGVNLSRGPAYRRMLARGFRADIQGVAMHRPDSPGYNRADVFIVDDWR